MIGFIIVVAIIAGIFLYDTLAWGWVLFKFWGWFVLPVFVAVPALTFIQALGLMFVIGLFKNHTPSTIKKQYRDDNSWLLFATPWFTLFFGWLAYVLFIL
jgi:hypothetical protein